MRPGALVLDLGAGAGILARALADAGARVLAVELDHAAAVLLQRRFGADPRVEVREADATALVLPPEPFSVVANLPFAAGTAILRRLLDDPRVPLERLDAIVEWGLAAKRTAVWPSTLLGCAWGARYDLSVGRRVPRACFAPPALGGRGGAPRRPAHRAARAGPRVRRATSRCSAEPSRAQAPLERVLPRPLVRRVAREHGFDPPRTRARPRRAAVGRAARGASDLPGAAAEDRHLGAALRHAR